MKSKYELRAFLEQFDERYPMELETAPIIAVKEMAEWVLNERDEPPQWNGIPNEDDYANRLDEVVPERYKDHYTENEGWADDLSDLGEKESGIDEGPTEDKGGTP